MRKTIPTLLLCAACSGGKPQVQLPPQVLELHEKAIVVDAHSDVTDAVYYENYDLAARHQDHHVDLPRMKEGGLDAEFFSIFVHPESVDINQFYPEAMKQIDALTAVARAHPDQVALARKS